MSPAEDPPIRRLAAVWFADIVEYSSLAGRDEAAALALVEALQAAARESVEGHGGRIVKFLGDGVLAEFGSADAATRSALTLQKAFAAQVEAAASNAPAAAGARLRVGVHVGEIVGAPDGDIYGDGVNAAARIVGVAVPGGVAISEDAWRPLRQQAEYRFAPLGERRLKGLANPLRLYAVEVGEAPVGARLPSAHRLSRLLARRRTAVAVVGALAIAGTLWALARERADPASKVEGADALEPGIAVLPLANVNPDPEDEYFSDGMTEELIAALGTVDGLRIVARTSAFAFKGKNADVREVGEKLGVGAVLEGSVRRAGERLRVVVRLVDAESGYQLWSETYDRESADVFAVQEEISRSVVAALAARLTSAKRPVVGEAPLVRKGTDDLEAYNLYLQGRFFAVKWSEEDVWKGLEYLERAIERDPGFARAYAELGRAYLALPYYASVEEALPRARAAARKALELDDSVSEAHGTIAEIASEYDSDWPTAEREFRRALELDPANGVARHRYAHLLIVLGRYEEATLESRRLLELDPVNPQWHHHLGWNYLMARRFDLVEAPFRKALDLDPHLRFDRGLGVLFAKQGRFAEAIRELEKVLEQKGATGQTMSNLAWGHATAGDTAAARAVLAEIARRGIDVPSWRQVYVHAALGEIDLAFDALERAYAERGPIFALIRDPRIDPLRADPRFAEFLKRMNLEP